MEQKKLLFGVVENKGDNIFLSLCDGFETFEEAVEFRKEKSLFRDESKLLIIQRIEVLQ